MLKARRFGSYPPVVDALWRDSIDYAVVIKEYGSHDADHRYSPAVCTNMEVRKIAGQPGPARSARPTWGRQSLTATRTDPLPHAARVGRLADVEARASVAVSEEPVATERGAEVALAGPLAAETPRARAQAPTQRNAADRFVRRVLRVRAPSDTEPDVHNLFSASMVLSGTRCLLSYIILPVLAPWLGALPLIGPAIGIPVGGLALVFDVRAIRRFFQADHRWRWVAAALYLVVMCMVATLVVRDILRLA